jgi:hypothetical protein
MPILENSLAYYDSEPAVWRERAEEARILAEDMGDPVARRSMLEIADVYERIAERADDRLSGRQSSPDR